MITAKSKHFEPKTLKDCIRVISTLREEIHKLNLRVKTTEDKIHIIQMDAAVDQGPEFDNEIPF